MTQLTDGVDERAVVHHGRASRTCRADHAAVCSVNIQQPPTYVAVVSLQREIECGVREIAMETDLPAAGSSPSTAACCRRRRRCAALQDDPWCAANLGSG